MIESGTYDDLSCVEYEYSVRVHDGVETMGDSEDSAVSEFAADRALDQRVRPANTHFAVIVAGS
jgi:hypothetical protein